MLCSFVVLLYPLLLAAADDWVTFTSAEQDFSILMHREPKATVRPDVLGEEVIVNYDFESWGETFGCMVSHKDVPYPDSSAEAVLDLETPDVDAEEWGLKQSKTKKIRYKGHPGREITVVSKKKGSIECWAIVVRILVVDANVYTLKISGPCEDLDRKTRKKFFNSFKLLEE